MRLSLIFSLSLSFSLFVLFAAVFAEPLPADPLNILSFEMSNLPEMKRYFSPPDAAQEVDLARHLPEGADRLGHANYLILSSVGATTGWHVDMSGLPTWVHIIRGQKWFDLLPGSFIHLKGVGA